MNKLSAITRPDDHLRSAAPLHQTQTQPQQNTSIQTNINTTLNRITDIIHRGSDGRGDTATQLALTSRDTLQLANGLYKTKFVRIASKNPAMTTDFFDLAAVRAFSGGELATPTKLKIKFYEPKFSAMLHYDGILVINGCRTREIASHGINKLQECIAASGQSCIVTPMCTINLIFAANTGKPIRLDVLYNYVKPKARYNKQRFSGLMFPLGTSSNGQNIISSTIFSSGNLVIMGAVNTEEAYNHYLMLVQIINESKSIGIHPVQFDAESLARSTNKKRPAEQLG